MAVVPIAARTNHRHSQEDPMLSITPLTTKRQVIVGNAVGDSLAANRPDPLAPSTRARAEEVVAATVAVSLYASVRPAQVDGATCSVVAGFNRTLEGQERSLRKSVIPHNEAQRVAADRAHRVRARLFPQGLRFLRRSMDLEWSDLVSLRGRMQEPDIVEAIDGLGLRPVADHVLAHIEMYGRVLGKDASKAGAGEARANAAWTDAFRLFSAQVLIDYHHDNAMQDELLGPYAAQLSQQRAKARAYDRPRSPAPAPGAPAPSAPEPAPPAPAPAPAPPAPAPEAVPASVA
jgi:hypothetical protein